MSETDTKNIEELYERMSPCVLCPQKCGADRRAGEKGKCRSTDELFISSHTLHSGEEPPISGTRGSGTIFLTNCNLSCVFCQNYPISQLGHGNKISIDGLAALLLDLQRQGAHNINFVSPTHMSAHVADATDRARKQGLAVPIVWNSNGYERVETLRLLEGFVDIYLPDAKYGSDASALKYSGANDYREVNREALKEMHRQKGILRTDRNGIAVQGMIIRHLILPEDAAASGEVLGFIARELSRDTFISLMAQYHPAHKSLEFTELARRISGKEYEAILQKMLALGLENGWQQGL